MKLFAVFIYFGLFFALAQTVPEDLSDKAIRDWLAQEVPTMTELAGLSTDEVCIELPKLLYGAPEGLDVNLGDRQALELPEGSPENVLRFSYPASQPGDIVGTVRVTLLKEEGEDWHVASIRYFPELGNDPLRSWLTSTVGAIFFTLFSALILYLSIRKTFFRAWLTEAWGYINQHRRNVIFSVVLLYGLFGLGYLAGTGLSQPCGDLLGSLVQQSIEQLGVADKANSGNVLGLSAAIFYQNFTFGAFFTTYIPALFFGIPAYLLNGSRFFALALLFGYSGLGGILNAILAIILILVELMAYIIVTAGGGMLLITVIKGGFSAFRLAYRKLLMMLPVAMLLLIIGAWYETFIILLPRLFSGTP